MSPNLFHLLLKASNDNELQRTTAIPHTLGTSIRHASLLLTRQSELKVGVEELDLNILLRDIDYCHAIQHQLDMDQKACHVYRHCFQAHVHL